MSTVSPSNSEGSFTPFDVDAGRVVAASLPASAAAPLPRATVDELDAAARGAFEACAGTPGAVVGVRTPEGSWTAAYGLADPEQKMPMETGVHMRIGSVTKTFVGTLLLQLVEGGHLALDMPVSAFVDGVPNGDRITLALLASMRSGVANYLESEPFVARVLADPTAVFHPADMIEAGLAISPSFEPDARFDYSNTNYTLLAQVIEHVAGQPIGDLICERIVEPLTLSATSWPGDSCEIPSPHARGFTLSVPSASPGHPVDTSRWNPSWAGAAGAVISTVADLLVFGRAVVTGQGLLGKHAQERRLRSLRPAPALGDGVSYGLALMSVDRWIGHSGDIPGYRAAMYHEPASDSTLVVLTNSDIMAGRCPDPVAATAMPSAVECKAPTARIFDDVATALGIPTTTPHPS